MWRCVTCGYTTCGYTTCHSCSNIILQDILSWDKLGWSALQMPKMLMIDHTMSTQTVFVASGRDNLMPKITGSFTNSIH